MICRYVEFHDIETNAETLEFDKHISEDIGFSAQSRKNDCLHVTCMLLHARC